jgi:hypothetical protein
MALTRKAQKLDTIYRTPDGQYFFTPDGDGRIWFEDLKEAREETGIVSRVVVLMTEPDDF